MEFLNRERQAEVVPSRIDPAFYNPASTAILPGMILYRGSRYTEFRYVLRDGALAVFEYYDRRDFLRWVGGRIETGVIGRAAIGFGSAVELSDAVADPAKGRELLAFAVGLLARIDDAEVRVVEQALRQCLGAAAT